MDLSKPIIDLSANNGLLEGLQDIRPEIIPIFDTAAETDEIIIDTSGLPLVLRDTSMGHAAGDFAQTLDPAQALGEDEDAGVLAEPFGSIFAALDTETEHSASAAVPVLLDGDFSLRVGFYAWVVDFCDVGGSFESVCDGSGVGGGLSCA